MPAALTTTTPSRIDAKLLRKAVEALLKHHNETKNEKSLLGDESFVHIQFGLDKVPQESSAKPKRVDIPHALWKTSDDDEYDGIQEPTVCLIVKEDSKEWVQELIAAFPKEMGLVKKVLGLDSLRKKHGRFDQQRALLHRFDVFMADDRILPMLGKSLGKHFFATKKQPIPVSLGRRTTLPVVILQSLRSTFWFLSEGTCLTVKAGTTGMSAQQIAENVAAVCAHVPSKIPRKWANVRSIAVKTNSSVALPIYNKTPAELKEIAKLAGIEDEEYVKEEPKPVPSETTNNATKKHKAAKSPLLKALKKQLEQEAAADNEPENGGSSKKKRKVSIDEEVTPSKSLSTNTSMVANNDPSTTEDKMKVVAHDGETPVAKKKHKAAQPSEATPQDKGVKRGGSDESSTKKKQKIEQGAETPKSKSPAIESTKAATSSIKKSLAVETKKGDVGSSKKSPAVETKKGDASSKKGNPASEVKKSGASANKSPAVESKKKDASSGSKSPAAEIKKSVASASKKSPAEMTSDVGSNKKGSKLTPKKDASTPSNETPKKGETFLASKKFVGSKSGYVFKSGNKGLGYYIDVKPKVDPMVIEALLRSSTQNRGGGGNGRKAKKSGRGRR